MELGEKKPTAKTLGKSMGGHSDHWLATAKETSKMAPKVLSLVNDDAAEKNSKIRSSRGQVSS